MEINGKNYEFKYSIRAMFVWESIMEKPFEISTLMDTYVFCFACIISNKDNPELDFDTFINACDENPHIIESFNDYIGKEMKNKEILNKKKVTKGRPKKNLQQ